MRHRNHINVCNRWKGQNFFIIFLHEHNLVKDYNTFVIIVVEFVGGRTK